jgi:farnesyl diphosphate synthase
MERIIGDELTLTSEKIRAQMDQFFGRNTALGAPSRLVEAMHYATEGGRKLRPYLVRACAQVFSKESEVIDKIAMAIEFLHASSLVHDDLPPFDDDNTRYGRPALHVRWDEGTAILVGNALNMAVFEVLGDEGLEIEDATKVRIIRYASRSSGNRGLIGGQILDIMRDAAPFGLDEWENITSRKVGALIEASCAIGAILGGAGEADVKRFELFGSLLSKLARIGDDTLDWDYESREEQTSSDVLPRLDGRIISIIGPERTKEMARELAQQARSLLVQYGKPASKLQFLVELMLKRVSV